MTWRLPELLELYARIHYVEGSTPATVHFYRKEVGLFFKFLAEQGHSLLPSDVSREDVLEHLARLREAGRKPRTLRTRRQAILTFFNWAVEWGKADQTRYWGSNQQGYRSDPSRS